MSRPVNPYIAGNPIRDIANLFGRIEILDWVSKELTNSNVNAIALFGQRRIGKTSILLTLQRILPKEYFLPVFFDLQGRARRPLGSVLSELAEAISRKANIN